MNIKKLFNVTYYFLFNQGRDGSMRKLKNSLPKKIKNYTLIRDLQLNKSYPFKVGLYNTDGDGTEKVIKVWRGPKNIHYYDLQHQIAVLAATDSLTERVKGKLPESLKNIKWPNLLEVIQDGQMTAVITNFIEASPIEKIKDVKIQWRYYNLVIEYLNQICRYMNDKEIKAIKKKTILRFLILLPYISVVAILENPNYTIKILKSVLCMIYALPAFINYNEFALIHGDLNYGNILANEKEIYLIDVEQTNISYSEFEYITTISTLGNTNEFKNKITDKIIELAKNDKRLSQRMGFLMLNCEIHNLTWNAPAENKVHYLELLDFGKKLALCQV